MQVHHGMRWAPRSHTGRWSVALAAGAVAGIALSIVGFATGVLESASGFSENWLLTGWGLAIAALGVAFVAWRQVSMSSSSARASEFSGPIGADLGNPERRAATALWLLLASLALTLASLLSAL